ncbi:transglutaminase domain-containing protein [Alkalihalobacillus sp. TS-13]|uniref:transglutaminase domain-containing protein n=1 Tax=Alkalihalobacillus sp. TS-13 TaxID=2842455 RepID=UPI001C86ED62|nr:transglutaminase domain-containing protein [Alkalihalobacillus sp. TS-13]
MNKWLTHSLMVLLLVLSACSPQSSADKTTEEPKDEYTALAEEKNNDQDLKKIELGRYAEEVGATLSSPKYQSFHVNSSFSIKGKVKDTSKFTSDYVMIKVQSEKESPDGEKEFEYFTPINDGTFEQKVQLFNGKGKYEVKVSLPDDRTENYFKRLAEFEVTNVNPKVKRDVMTRIPALEHDLKLENLPSGFFEEDEFFTLNGTVEDAEMIMVKVDKENESSKVMIPVAKDGTFAKEIPLFYGKGVHKATIMTPDEERENYYNEAAVILVDNQSEKTYTPIKYSKVYQELGYSLEYPKVGGEETDLSYPIKGEINPDAPYADQTEVVFVSTKKGEDEAMYSIPVEDYKFDGEVFLRFGPGEYEVSVFAPDFERSNGDYRSFTGLANFMLKGTAEDKRNLLPSKGIQSDHPEIESLAGELTNGKTEEREKAKAVYEYVAKNVTYDVDKLNNESFEFDDSALKTLNEKTGVCEDYSYLTIALLRASGMEARMVTGRATFSFARHAWVETKVDGKWLLMDPTWGSGYLKDDKFVKEYTDKYFDQDPKEFDKDHSREDIQY